VLQPVQQPENRRGDARSGVKKPIPFGKYMLLERVNVGGMAEVFKAKAFGVEGFERLVAVKRILPSIAEDTEFITMFIDEAKIAVQLTHANIAQIFDLGKVGDSYFIAMEYVHGKDLRAIFDRARKRGEPLPVPMACYVVMKICEGLDYAHNKKDPAGRDLNLVHRDVSPQNMLISYDGEVKIIDFGIAKAAGKAGKTQAGILKGKFGYMSPEQVRGLPLDRRSDIFAVGICLYELLTGERLFVGESDFSTLEKVRNVEIMPPSTYNRRIPEELEQIVLKALAKDVDDRYQTAMDLHDDLQSFMYTSGNFFARKDLSSYMRKGFADEITKETARDEEYRKLDTTGAGTAEGSSSGLAAFADLEPVSESDVGPEPQPPQGHHRHSPVPPPPPANLSAPARTTNPGGVGAPAAGGLRKPTMMGMGISSGAPPPPPGRASMPGPPPPPPPRASIPNPPPAAPPPQQASMSGSGSPGLDMDWDDEELSTQIYDKPEGGEYMAQQVLRSPSPAAAPPSAPLPRPGVNAVSVPGPIPSTTYPGFGSSPGSIPVQPGIAGPPMPAPKPSFPPKPPAPLPGAPSPFDDAGAPPPPRPFEREPTSLTRGGGAPKKKGGGLGIAIAAAAVILLGGIGFGGWWVFLRATPGEVHLTTSPPDAVVLFDEQPVPATSSPFVIRNVEPGTPHLIEISKTGYVPFAQRVTIEPGETRVLAPVTLSQSTGVGPAVVTAPGAPSGPVTGTGFTLDTLPPGARVFVDEREQTQRTPVAITDLTPGLHSIRVDNGPRYSPWQTQITVNANQVMPIPRAVLVQNAVGVDFRSDPEGARVTLVRGSERRTVGNTPTQFDVPLGGAAWTVEMTKDGYQTWTQTLVPIAGQETTEVRGVLTRQQVAAVSPGGGGGRTKVRGGGGGGGGEGTLRINTRPWSQVYVDGQLIGNTPQMNIPLRAGRHRVTLVNSDFNIRETVTVTIRAGQTETKIITLTPGGG
jgi:serine/threonine protein kinase